jgi:hypothetical protein
MNDERTRWYSRSGVWFWLIIALGAALRLYLVLFTEGTRDVAIWEQHARHVRDLGLIGYYHADASANHPPFISEAEALLLRASDATAISFRILLRAPFALFDAGTTCLLLLLFGASRWRFVATAAYWLSPLSIIFSAYHGNTDSAIAFFLVLCVWLLSKDQLLAAAIALGVSAWIKLPGVLAVPALAFFIDGWRSRFRFVAIAGAVALTTYVPALLQDAAIIWQNVFGYRAQIVHSTAGVPAWGPRVLFFSIIAAPQKWPQASHAPILFFLANGWLIAVLLVVLLVWLHHSKLAVPGLCAAIAGSYVMVATLSDGFSFQYFAWALPFWLFLPRWFCIPALVLVSGYVYSLYAYLCGNPWLLGVWDFIGHPYWPSVVIALRNAGYLIFFACATWFLVAGLLHARNRASPAV